MTPSGVNPESTINSTYHLALTPLNTGEIASLVRGSSMSKDDIVTIYADILQVTDAAVLADCAGEEVWLPLSQVDFFGEKGDVGVIMTLPEWLADEKGLSDGDGVRRGAVPPSNESESSSAEEEPHICETCDHVEGFFCYSQREDDSCPDPCAKCHRLFDDPTDDESYPDHWCPQPQEEDEVSGVAQAPASPAEASFLKTETITVSIPLDLEERESVGDRMACALEQIAALEDDLDSYRKRINAEIKSLQKDAERARKEWQEGKSENDVYCDVMADYSAEAIIWLVHDTSKEIKRRPMTAEERQYRLPIPRPGSGSVNSSPDAARNMQDVEVIFGKARSHSCIDCGNLAQDDSAMPEPCQSCSQCHSGDSDNWTPRHECRTCSHSQTQVNMPPCAGCALNVEECYQGDAEGWEWQEATSVDDKMSLDTDLESVAEHQEEPSEEGFFDPSTGAITSMISAASHDDAPMLPQ